MVKIAYLILAHKDPEQIKRLCDKLVKTGDVYIHIDKKVDIKPFIDALNNEISAFFATKRYSSNWASFSIVKSYLQLLGDAFNSEKNYDRFVFLTGQDYPLMSDREIIFEFEKNKDTEYVMAYNIAHSSIPTDRNKIEKKWYLDPPFKSKLLRKIYCGFMYRVITKYFRLSNLQVPLNGNKVDPYFGQMLCAFTRSGAELIYTTYLNDKKFNKVMKHALAPDEIYWQTVIFNSELRKNTVQDGKEHEITEHFGWAPLHYHHYDVYTSVFTEKDYDEIVNSGYMFIRKVAAGVSDSLMDKIDEYRSKNN